MQQHRQMDVPQAQKRIEIESVEREMPMRQIETVEVPQVQMRVKVETIERVVEVPATLNVDVPIEVPQVQTIKVPARERRVSRRLRTASQAMLVTAMASALARWRAR